MTLLMPALRLTKVTALVPLPSIQYADMVMTRGCQIGTA